MDFCVWVKICLRGIKKPNGFLWWGFLLNFAMHVFVLSPCYTFLDATLAKTCEEHYRFFFFCFYSWINMAGVENALEFDVEKGFFFKTKKCLIFSLIFVIVTFWLLILCFMFLSSFNVFIYRSTKMQVCILMRLHVSPFLLTISITLFYFLLSR